jgi:hypothetical protein
MLLPDKHIKIAESLLGLGSFALEALDKPKTIDHLWSEFRQIQTDGGFPAYHSFENLVLAVDFLFCIGVVSEQDNGYLAKCV